MRVVVEGVETAEELAFLRDSTAISFAQGYYFSKPIVFEKAPARRDERAGTAGEPARQERSDRKKTSMRRIETRRH